MAEIDGGALSFKSVMDNDQMNAAIDETLRRVQGLSDGTVVGGQKMDAAFDNTADGIRNALGQIGAACEMHEQALQNLESEYQRLGQQAGVAFMAGRDEEYQAITQQQAAIKGEMTVREHLIRDLQEQSNRLEDTASKMEENKRKVEENANAHVSMRTRIKEVREEMMLLVDQGIDEQSEAYQRLKNELGRLIDIQGDVAQQGKILANDEQKYQGIIQGLSGLAGGFSAVTGTVSLFAGENEDLQKVMTKVQSVMAITIGLQQVAQTLNKDSAFMLVTVRKAKELLTIAEGKFAVALGVSNVAAKALMATLTLGLSVAIGAAIYLWDKFNTKSKEAKKAAEEFSKSLIEGCYKPIGTIEMLSSQWDALGDNMKAKEKFIKDNKKSFDDLGVSVKNVTDAENILVANKDKFIDAQIAKAKATVYVQQAMEETKNLIEAQQKLDAIPKTKLQTGGEYTDGYGVKRKTKATIEVENPEWTKANNVVTDIQDKMDGLFEKARKSQVDAFDLFSNTGADIIKDYADGTIGAIEKELSENKDKLKGLLPSSQEFSDTKKSIADLEKQLEGITGKKTAGGSSNSKKDPFLEELEKQKKEYTRFQKWMNSGDDVLSKAATTEFDGLLKQGATYIDYLKKQREIILSVDVANRSKAQNQQLRTLNDQIAEETKKTVLESFNTELSEQLNNAKTTLEILNIISQKRKELANDGTDVDNGKKDTLDEAEKDAIQKQKEETDTLLDEYSSYLDQRVKLHQKYLDDIALLEKRKQDAQSPEEAAQVQRTIDNRTKQYEKDKKGTGDVDYDAMVQQYATFEQKKQSIIDEYDEKRKNAVAMAAAFQKELEQATTDEQRAEIEKRIFQNNELQESINKNETKDIEKLTVDDLMESDTWNQLFGNLDNLTASEMIKLRDKIESDWAKLKLSPEQLEALRNKIGEVTTKIEEKNPFLALADAIKKYKAGEKDVDFKDIAKSAGDSIALISGAFDAVVGGMEKMGIQMDEETQAIIGDIGGILDGASQLASGIATGNPLAIIQGGIGLLSSAFSLFNSRDRKAERSIKRHAESLKKLQSSYEDLERVVERALGGDRYSSQKNSIENLKQQQVELSAMADAERSKKKSDKGKIEEYEKTIKDNANQIADIINGMREELLGLDAASAAEQLGNAFIDAFSNGEDAAAAWGAKVDDIVGNIMRKMLIQKLLEQPMGKIFDKYSKKWYDDNGNFAGFDAVMSDAGKMGDEMKGLGSGFASAMENLPDDIKKYFIGKGEDEAADTSLTGAVKGVSEETASIVAGQMNAIRINQMEATSILRQQLMHLATIAQNTSYNKHLVSIDKKLDGLNGSDPLRSKGLL